VSWLPRRDRIRSLVVLLAAAPIDRPAFAYVAKISRGSSNLEVGPFFWQNLNCWCDRSLRALAEGENRQHPAMSICASYYEPESAAIA
jgi:hypothetical protein